MKPERGCSIWLRTGTSARLAALLAFAAAPAAGCGSLFGPGGPVVYDLVSIRGQPLPAPMDVSLAPDGKIWQTVITSGRLWFRPDGTFYTEKSSHRLIGDSLFAPFTGRLSGTWERTDPTTIHAHFFAFGNPTGYPYTLEDGGRMIQGLEFNSWDYEYVLVEGSW